MNDNDSDDESTPTHSGSGSSTNTIENYRPQVSIYERKEFRPLTQSGIRGNSNGTGEASSALTGSIQCKAPDCWAKAYANTAFCLKHVYQQDLHTLRPTSSATPMSSSSSSSSSSSPSSSPSPSSPVHFSITRNSGSSISSNNSTTTPTSSRVPSNHSNNANAAGTGTGSLSSSDKRAEERRLLAEELVSTEKTYSQALKTVMRSFILRLQKYEELDRTLITKAEIAKCFGNIGDIADLSQRLYGDLKKLKWTNQLLTPQLGQTLSLYTPFFRLYLTYVGSYEENSKFLKSLREARPQFDFFMTLNEKSENSLIDSLMITPVQRIPRYLLLLRGIEKITDPSDPLLASLQEAVKQVETVARDINNSFHVRECRQRVVDVQRHLEGQPVVLVSPTRFHVRDGPLLKKFNNTGFKMSSFKRYWFFLFNDILIYTTIPNVKGDCKLKYILPLEDMSVHDVSEEVASSMKVKHAFELKSGVKDLFLAVETEAEKKQWVSLLQTNISQLLKNKASIKGNNQVGSVSSSSNETFESVEKAFVEGGFW